MYIGDALSVPFIVSRRNIRICLGKKHIVSVTYENERISIKKKQLTLLKMCVTSLLCGPRADLCPFYGFLCERFSPYIKVYQGWGLHRLSTPAKGSDGGAEGKRP